MKAHFSLVAKAHELIGAGLRPGDLAIDATVGNGHDTMFLLRRVAPGGRVYGFDIQHAALDSAQARVDEPALRASLTLFEDSHVRMLERIPQTHHGSIKAIMFNLGYLPGGDKTVTTQAESTLAALSSASRLLCPQGVLTIVAYPGHAGGARETEQVRRWCEALEPNCFRIERYDAKPNDASAPRLFAVTRNP